MNRMATVVELRMLLSNTQQLALMSAEISLQQTWKNCACVGRREQSMTRVCSLCFLGSRETRLGRGVAGRAQDTAPHNTAIQ